MLPGDVEQARAPVEDERRKRCAPAVERAKSGAEVEGRGAELSPDLLRDDSDLDDNCEGITSTRATVLMNRIRNNDRIPSATMRRALRPHRGYRASTLQDTGALEFHKARMLGEHGKSGAELLLGRVLRSGSKQ